VSNPPTFRLERTNHDIRPSQFSPSDNQINAYT